MKIKNITLSRDYKQLLKNFISLSSLQGLNYIMPLITLPYLIRVIGTSNFGIWVYVLNLISYFQTFTEYGFQLSGTKEISQNKSDINKLSRIFSAILQIKIIFLIILFVILVLILMLFQKLNANKELFIFSYGMVIGQALFPIWFFQGIEKMSYITTLSTITRTLNTIAIFTFINSTNDLNILPLIYSLSSLLLGISSLYLAIVKFKIRIFIQPISIIKYHLKDGWHIFISSFSVNIYLKSNIIILGIFANDFILGQYAIVEKVILAIRGISVVIFQSIYPYVCRLAIESSKKLNHFFKRLFFPLGIVFFGLGVYIFIYSGFLINIVSGKDMSIAISLLKILSFLPLIVTLNIPFYQALIALSEKKIYTSIMTLGAILNIILTTILSDFFVARGAAASLLSTEIFITVALFIMYQHVQKKIERH